MIANTLCPRPAERNRIKATRARCFLLGCLARGTLCDGPMKAYKKGTHSSRWTERDIERAFEIANDIAEDIDNK
jgi:hypothetical protein